MMIRMGNSRRASAPDNGPDPGEGHDKHVQNSAKHEDLNGAKALRETCEVHAKNAIENTENGPRDEA